jgi:hypothetical protein
MPALGRQRKARSLSVWGQPGLHSEFQDSQSYIVRPCLKTTSAARTTTKENKLIISSLLVYWSSNLSLMSVFLLGSAFTTSDNLSLSSWVSSSSSFPGFQHPQPLTALGTSTASIATPIPHPIQGSLPPYSRLGMPLTPSAIASSMQGSGPTFPSFHMPRYHHYFQQGPYAAIQGLRHSSAVMTPFVWFHWESGKLDTECANGYENTGGVGSRVGGKWGIGARTLQETQDLLKERGELDSQNTYSQGSAPRAGLHLWLDPGKNQREVYSAYSYS